MLLLSTVSLNGYGLHRILTFAKNANYNGIDLALTKTSYDYWDEDYVKLLTKQIGVPVLSITAPARGMSEKIVDRIVKLAIEVGAQNITFFPPHVSDKNINWYTSYLSRVKRDTHISISIQNVEPKFIFWLIPEFKNASLYEIKKVTGNTALDLSNIDVGAGMDILKAQKIMGSSIKNIYFSDKHGPKKGLLPGSAGGGTSYLPLESFLMKLRASGYGAFLTLKIVPREMGVGTEEKVIQNLESFKNYYNKHFLSYRK